MKEKKRAVIVSWGYNREWCKQVPYNYKQVVLKSLTWIGKKTEMNLSSIGIGSVHARTEMVLLFNCICVELKAKKVN